MGIDQAFKSAGGKTYFQNQSSLSLNHPIKNKIQLQP